MRGLNLNHERTEEMRTKNIQWQKAPAKGCTTPMAGLHRFTTVRLSDKAERFTDTLPPKRLRLSPDYMVWDNQLNAEWVD